MIPTYNCAATLGATLSSVLEQDLGPEHMQIEVVDDSSDHDDPEAVVRDVGGGRVTFFRQPRNVGHVKNFESCIQRSRGRFVHLLHGDDYVLKGFYDALQRGFESDPSVGAAFCRWMIVDEAGIVQTISEPLRADAGELADADVLLASEQHIVTPSIAVRRDVYELLGGFDERLQCAEDWEMWIRIAAQFEVWYEPAVLAAYRSHPGSNTGRHHRLAAELRYTAMVIDMVGSYLAPDRAERATRTARRTYARTAVSNARQFSAAGDREAARAHLRLAIELSRSPRNLLEAAKLLPRVVGS
jgi:GT2 family glycosyltransferase